MKKYLIIALGCLLYAVGVGVFLDASDVFAGGVTGISMILSRIFPINTGVFILAINIPIMVLGRIAFGRKFLLLTFLGICLSSLFVFLIEFFLAPYLPITGDRLVSALAGQGLLSLGLALVFHQGATTGGMDVIVKLISKKYPYITMGKIIFLIDFAVIFASGIVLFNFESVIYSLVALFTGNVIFDKVLYGFDEAGIAIIICEKYKEITEKLLQKQGVGVTVFEGTGAYSNENKKVLFVTVKKRLLPKIKNTVKETDANSFMVVASANEVFGKGFKG